MSPREFDGPRIGYSAIPDQQHPVGGGLVGPSIVQIRAAKAHIVALASHIAFLQSHIDQLEHDLASFDPADVAKVKVPGYPPAK